MIIQSPPCNENENRRFVIKLAEHLELVGQLAETYGNSEFEIPAPREEFLYVCRWHDKGWQDLDDNPPLDRDTGLPYNLVETPLPIIILTSARSPEHNESVSPYCGLIDSMHIWGLYNGRYGMSDKVLIDIVPEEYKLLAKSMLENEFQRQNRLKAKLSSDPQTAAWVEDSALFMNYKILQFFDTLALYFNCTHGSQREQAKFSNVPQNKLSDATITISPVDEFTYSLDPYPFRNDNMEIVFNGRYLDPIDPDTKPDMAMIMSETPTESQRAILVRA